MVERTFEEVDVVIPVNLAPPPKEKEERTEAEPELKNQKKGESISKEDEKPLRELAYYHGYLSREDCVVVLRQEGDFLLRISEPEKDGRQLILSILASQQPQEKEERPLPGNAAPQLKLRHVLVVRNQGQYRVDTTMFPSINDLVLHYMQNNCTSMIGAIRLKKGCPLKDWEYGHSDVKLGSKMLGEGAFGEVREGVLTRRKKKKEVKVAVKLVKGQGEASKEKLVELMREARIQNTLKHPNVVRLYGILTLEQPIGILLELVDGGCLTKYLQAADHLIETKERLTMCTGAANGLAYIHQNRIIHRDVAARNCLYSPDKVVKISDFGLSKRVAEGKEAEYRVKKTQKLPIKWLAPETIKEYVFSWKTDVYSYGLLVFEIFSNGTEPWDGVTNADTKKKVTAGEFPSLPSSCPQKLRDFVHSRIFVLDKLKRTSMPDVGRFLETLMAEAKMLEVQIEPSVATNKTQRTDDKTAPRSSREPPPDEIFVLQKERHQPAATPSSAYTPPADAADKKSKENQSTARKKKAWCGQKKFRRN